MAFATHMRQSQNALLKHQLTLTEKRRYSRSPPDAPIRTRGLFIHHETPSLLAVSGSKVDTTLYPPSPQTMKQILLFQAHLADFSFCLVPLPMQLLRLYQRDLASPLELLITGPSSWHHLTGINSKTLIETSRLGSLLLEFLSVGKV